MQNGFGCESGNSSPRTILRSQLSLRSEHSIGRDLSALVENRVGRQIASAKGLLLAQSLLDEFAALNFELDATCASIRDRRALPMDAQRSMVPRVPSQSVVEMEFAMRNVELLLEKSSALTAERPRRGVKNTAQGSIQVSSSPLVRPHVAVPNVIGLTGAHKGASSVFDESQLPAQHGQQDPDVASGAEKVAQEQLAVIASVDKVADDSMQSIDGVYIVDLLEFGWFGGD